MVSDDFWSHIVSSQLDADRCDYLLRDSYAAGVDYGKFDLKWVIDHLKIDDSNDRFYFDKKALRCVEQYIFSRYHMYQSVYFHKATRSAEVMLRLLFNRFKEMLSDGEGFKKNNVIPGVPESLIKAFSVADLSLDEYLDLDDFTMSEFFKCCEKSSDDIVAKLACGLLNRKLYKCVDATDYPQGRIGIFYEKAKGTIEGLGLDPEYSFSGDTPTNTPYKVYDPGDDAPATQIFVENSSGRIRAINNESELVNTLIKKTTQLRYYFPEEVRDSVEDIFNQCKEGE